VLSGALARVTAQSGAGSVQAQVESLGGGSLHTGAGNLRLSIAGGVLTEALTCTAGAGAVEIALPGNFAADVTLSTAAGALTVRGADLDVRRNFVGGSATGKLGAGGRRNGLQPRARTAAPAPPRTPFPARSARCPAEESDPGSPPPRSPPPRSRAVR